MSSGFRGHENHTLKPQPGYSFPHEPKHYTNEIIYVTKYSYFQEMHFVYDDLNIHMQYDLIDNKISSMTYRIVKCFRP